MIDKIEFDELPLGKTTPCIVHHPAFPLKDEIKSYGKILRVEPDGTVFSYTSPDFLNVCLVIKYGQLYLKWAFSGDENGTRFYEYNMEFPYTGTFKDLSFEEGKLVEKYNKYGQAAFKGQTYETFPKEMFQDDFTEVFISDFCKYLKEKCFELKKHHDELSRMFKEAIPKDNIGTLNDEITREKIYKYMHCDYFIFCDEYEIVRRVIREIAQTWFEVVYPESKRFGLLFTQCFESRQWRFVERHLYNAFDRKALGNIIKRCLEDVDSKTLASELKNEFLEIMTLVPCKIEIKLDRSVRPCSFSNRKRLRDYLDDGEEDKNNTTDGSEEDKK